MHQVRPISEGQAASVDWKSCIARCLAGTTPRHARDDWLVPGLTREKSRELMGIFPAQPKPAAVLIPLVEREQGLTVLLTQRASQLKNHPGQISFPGGSIEPGDESPLAAALREAREEIGLQPQFVTPVGYLTDHVIISGFLVTPVVGFVTPGFELLLDPTEVQDTFEVPLTHAFEPSNHQWRRRRFGDGRFEAELCDIPYGDRNIWGATAGMLLTLYRLCTTHDRG